MTRPVTAPLAQVALHRSNVVDMPPSSYRPAPPSTRPRIMPPSALEPDRSLVEGYSPPARETTLRSAPEPPKEASDMAGKKKMTRSPESIAKMKATLAAKRAAKQAAAAAPPMGRPAFDGLDLILDIIELCERAKTGLSKSQRARLKAALDERLS
jgi:hypothetical protein